MHECNLIERGDSFRPLRMLNFLSFPFFPQGKENNLRSQHSIIITSPLLISHDWIYAEYLIDLSSSESVILVLT